MRKLRINIIDRTQNKVLWNFDETQKLQVDTNPADGCCDVKIFGLKTNKFVTIATNTLNFLSPEGPKFDIEIAANNSRIFYGTITEAAPDYQTANYSIHLKAFNCVLDGSEGIEVTAEAQLTAAELAERIIAEVYRNQKNKPIVKDYVKTTYKSENPYYHKGSLLSHCSALEQIFQHYNPALDIRMNLEKTELQIRTTLGAFNSTQPTITLNSNRIIKGIVLTPGGCSVTTYFNPAIRNCLNIKINSYRYPQLSQYLFQLVQYSHHLETFGNSWFSNLNLLAGGTNV